MHRSHYARHVMAGIALVVLFVTAGCETQMESSLEPMSLQARSATDVLPSGARVAGMIDVQALQKNPAIRPFDDGFVATGRMSGEAGTRLHDFLTATGFDPETDIQQVYFAAGGDGADTRASLVVYATFDQERLQDYFSGEMADAFDASPYRGATIYSARTTERGMSFALANGNMIVASPDVAEVQAMLDRLAGGGASMSDDATTMQLIGRVAGGSSVWFVGRQIGDAVDEHSKQPEESETVRAAARIGDALQDAALSVDLQADGADGRIVLQVRPGVDANDVADLVRGLVAGLKAEPGLSDDKLRTLDRVAVTTGDDVVTVRFFVDNGLLEQMD